MFSTENCLSSLTTDTTGQLDVLWHDGDTLGVDSAQVGVLKQTNQISLAGLLESHNGRALESEISFKVLCDFTYQTLKGQFPDEQFSALLVPSDFTESDSSGPVSVGFLHSAGSRCTLASCLGGQLFPWGLATS